MTDEQIEQLKLLVEKYPAGSDRWVAWRTEEPTRHDGMGLTGSRHMPVYRKVTGVGVADDEPVAFLGDGYGGYAALWCCEASEFLLVQKIWVTSGHIKDEEANVEKV